MKLTQTFPLALFISIWTAPNSAKADAAEATERPTPDGTIGIGFSALFFSPAYGLATGVGLLGGSYGSVSVEPRLSDSVALIATLRGNYTVVRFDADTYRSGSLAPGVGVRYFVNPHAPAHFSGYVLGLGSYAYDQPPSAPTEERVAGGLEAGVTVDGDISDAVSLRLSTSIISAEHSFDPDDRENPISVARIGVEPFLGFLVNY